LGISTPCLKPRTVPRMIETSLEATIQQKFVTYDFERLMPGSTKVRTSEFAKHMVGNMVDRRKKTAV
jgi:isocitrate dehydrogenase